MGPKQLSLFAFALLIAMLTALSPGLQSRPAGSSSPSSSPRILAFRPAINDHVGTHVMDSASETDSGADIAESFVAQERRHRAAAAFHDGILLLHANSRLDSFADGFRQDPFFYYFTGLENTVGAVLAIDGKLNESWLFLPSEPPFSRIGLQPEVKPGPEAAQRLGMEHVVDWTQLQQYFVSHAGEAVPLYYAADPDAYPELPSNLFSPKSGGAPTWRSIFGG